MSTDTKLKVTQIQRFCMHDGPGLRTTVFFKGCPLRCKWCHNPETQSYATELLFYDKRCISCGACVSLCKQSVHALSDTHTVERTRCTACGECERICPAGALELCGKELGYGEILDTVLRDQAFYGKDGGITLSGGEPLCQGEGVVEFLRLCKARGLNTAIETCGYVPEHILRAALPLTDIFLWDLKDTDPERHKLYTGADLSPILKNLALADSLDARIRIRCIIVNGVNTEQSHYRSIGEIAKALGNLDCVELIPYHAYAGGKSVFLGKPDTGVTEWIPSKEELSRAKETIEAFGVRVAPLR